MTSATAFQRQEKPLKPNFGTLDPRQPAWTWSEESLRQWQLLRLNEMLESILPRNRFYAEKLGLQRLQLKTLDELHSLPFTTKLELVQSQNEHGTSDHHTFDTNDYCRVHRTSGMRGEPLVVMDTADDWQWWADTWQHVLSAADVTSHDRVFMAFSFGPFIGFWSAYEAFVQRGARLIPGGGLSTLARLEFMKQTRPTLIACTPSYAMQLAQVASENHFPLRELGVRHLIVAGEPGGSIESVRDCIQTAWGARVIDHSGATEVGPWGFGWPDGHGLHVIESSFIAELIDPVNLGPSHQDGLKELVLTSIGRWGAPVLRYRTGDLVRARESTNPDCNFLWLEGGIIGRADDMVVVRGVNIFPSSIDAVLRRFPDVAEYRVTVVRKGQLDELILELEASPETTQSVVQQLDIAIGLRIVAKTVPSGHLPRCEGKGNRWIDARTRDAE